MDAHTSDAPGASTPTATRRPDRLLPSLLTLAATTFVAVTAEMLPAAVLPYLSHDLGVTVGQAGLLVSIWAATVVLASFPLARWTARFDRRTVITWALVTLASATAVTAVADDFLLAAGSRVVGAGATGLLWSTVNAHAAAIAPEQRLTRATAVVLGGATAGTVLAVPLGHTAAGVWGWRAPFLALAVLALLTAVLVRVVLAPRGARKEGGNGTSGERRPLTPLIMLGALGGLIFAAHFGAFTFVAALLEANGSLVPTSVLLLLFGMLSAAGVVAVGQAGDRYPNGLLIAISALVATTLAGLMLLGVHPLLDVLLIAAWGAATGGVGPAVQARIMRAAGAEHRTIAGALIPVTFNLGIAIGAGIGSATVDFTGVTAVPAVATALAALATVGLVLAARHRPRPARVSASGRIAEVPCS
ncbi:MFS transporter [Lysobacter korlensis]|uniref:MFS transporter n=1 Tax=Lysobacter korlensis TaxID=553636 RepID=A0ABV6RWC6_9GAMM